MIFNSVQSFLDSNAFRNLVSGTPRLRAFFTTYNAVYAYQPGFVATGSPDLTVEVENHAEPAREAARAEAIIRAIDSRAADALCARTETDVRMKPIPLVEGERLLVVLYAGRNAMDANVRRVRVLRAAHPRMALIIVTCLCDMDAKRPVFNGLMRERLLDGVVIGNCGGQSEMKLLLEALICDWHAHRRTKAPLDCVQRAARV